MLELPKVTLLALTGKNFKEHDEAIRKSCDGISWGAVKLIYDYGCNSIDEWNRKIIYELHRYVDTEFCMLIHADGYVINPEAWKDEFLNYDYIGAPWPLPTDDYSYRTPSGRLIRVGNSVSLRSKRLLEAPTRLNLPWGSFYGNTNEDGFLCVHNRELLESRGMVFAPLEIAVDFSREHSIPENEGRTTFAFHTVDVC